MTAPISAEVVRANIVLGPGSRPFGLDDSYFVLSSRPNRFCAPRAYPRPHNCFVASRAPSTIAASFAQATSGCTCDLIRRYTTGAFHPVTQGAPARRLAQPINSPYRRLCAN